MNSKRTYTAIMAEGVNESKHTNISVEQLINESTKPDEYEFIYALQGEVDKILDLQKGQSMYFIPNRDDSESKGILIRTV